MASTTGRRVVELLTNKSGGAVAAGDVVIVDTSNDSAFTTTTSASYAGVIGVAQEAIANNAAGRVCTAGAVTLVNVPSSVTRGHYIFTHTVAKQATGASSRATGAFGQFLTGGTTPAAHLFGITDSGLGGTAGFTSGTSNPGSPSTGDLFFRTDLNMMFRYNGTRWLCTCPHTHNIANQHLLLVVSATNSLRAGPPAAEGCSDIWLTTLDVGMYVTTTNNGTSYWTVAWGATSVSTAADAANTVLRKTASIGAVWNFATDKWFQVDFTKVSSPGTAYPLVSIGFRYIAP